MIDFSCARSDIALLSIVAGAVKLLSAPLFGRARFSHLSGDFIAIQNEEQRQGSMMGLQNRVSIPTLAVQSVSAAIRFRNLDTSSFHLLIAIQREYQKPNKPRIYPN